MKKIILSSIIIVLFILILSGNSMAQSQREILNLAFDISPYITLEVGDDININLDQPWQGGEVREAISNLHLKTNTEVELSWESTALINKETGKILPLGIPVEFIERLIRGETVKATDQPFGLNTFLRKKEAELGSDNSFNQGGEQDSVLKSILNDNKNLQSQQAFILDPGVYNFDIVIQYYWSRESNWSQIRAGEYQGEIIYTVSAVDGVN
ncbi:hypothetical protein [Halanaerobium sp. ST460_2HS_T2]|uniref:hypothetical protein n=1 Tax=Halanaerobium sp. ST460_2HS_T2 TaxID=2183914 RepID=UPI000DF1264B|nr:hypothetical protein [Halanaerobium sp. ST460_2HS_T2]RCW52331.1 hypothetical protein DFR80_13023 [Halanaerobium sp. ST460_2HS_T2]